MKKTKYLVGILFIILILLIPNFSKSAEGITVSSNFYSSNGSVKFKFTGVTIDEEKQYEFCLTKTKAETATTEDWFDVTELTSTSVTVDINTGLTKLKSIVDTTNTAYIMIREKNAEPENKVFTEAQQVNLEMPYLLTASPAVLNNGKEFNSINDVLTVAARNLDNSTPFYKYEKITDNTIIAKYREIKESGDDVYKMQSMLKTEHPESGWIAWTFWNGYGNSTGSGYPTKTVNAPGEGLYYLWIKFTAKAGKTGLKDLYGYILVDNLAPEVKLEKISITPTATLEMGKTLKLDVTFTPTGATNKVVNWKSSNEEVATVDNAGTVTPKKVGSTIITVTSEDGGFTSSCTVTIIEAGSAQGGSGNTSEGNGSGGSGTGGGAGTTTPQGGNSSGNQGPTQNPSGSGTGTDGTTMNGKLPQTGVGIGMTIALIATGAFGVLFYRRYRVYKDI